MRFFCTFEFEQEYRKITKNRRFKDFGKDLCDYLSNKTPEQLCTGDLLNGNLNRPYIKKRIGDSDALRIYYYMVIVNEKLYLMYVHAKPNSGGIDNVGSQKKAELYKNVLAAITENQLYEIQFDENKDVTFTLVST